ncbi:transcriptional regulator [Paractinoplanes abujensis]|uniref:Transcriptional regulator with XRE-family HTH domain n=1 Tax=Paractinoplanes abujensis TaxID=882441 RepID=A0A7W7CW61_9ACTN|nr:helix-turn-helix transcriptional regulator [Actinoplanes abujensis]MBB4695758.1 transcriptional regulator with XRE-family HTH domain [Actinoplanes abujensis]GID23342.1 transcriptional regulator [Actinoplanes abujensis]
MAEGDSPTIARLRVRLAVREAREASGLTQADVAEAMEWSNSKVIRIENGDNTISINDLKGLLTLLGVTDKDHIDALLADARVARRRQQPVKAWWQEPRFREQMTDDLRRFVEYEAEASEIRSYNILYVPGPLQTPEYATALTRMWQDERSESESPRRGGFSQEKVAALVEARRLRREGMLSRLDSLKYLILFDESVLLRPAGGPAVFAAQLQQIVELSARGMFRLRMLPFDLGTAIANNGTFDLLKVGTDRAGSEVMYRENGPHDEMVENRDETARHRNRFDQLWEVARNEGDTIAFIEERRAIFLGAESPNL